MSLKLLVWQLYLAEAVGKHIQNTFSLHRKIQKHSHYFQIILNLEPVMLNWRWHSGLVVEWLLEIKRLLARASSASMWWGSSPQPPDIDITEKSVDWDVNNQVKQTKMLICAILW